MKWAIQEKKRGHKLSYPLFQKMTQDEVSKITREATRWAIQNNKRCHKINQIKTRKNCFRYLKLVSPQNASICTPIGYTLWVEWYYLKNNYLTFRSKVKISRRSLWYATHRLMFNHTHTKYHWPISKDKNVMARTRKYYLKINYLTLRSKFHERHYGMRHTAL